MLKIVSLILLVGGLVLIGYGFSASESMSSEVSEVVSGRPNNDTFWLLGGGIVAVIIGLAGLWRRPSA